MLPLGIHFKDSGLQHIELGDFPANWMEDTLVNNTLPLITPQSGTKDPIYGHFYILLTSPTPHSRHPGQLSKEQRLKSHRLYPGKTQDIDMNIGLTEPTIVR